MQGEHPVQHLEHARPGDLLLMDRNYPSYRMVAELSRRNLDFVIRCSSSSFSAARKMLKGEGPDCQVKTCGRTDDPLPATRFTADTNCTFLRVLLDTGEYC